MLNPSGLSTQSQLSRLNKTACDQFQTLYVLLIRFNICRCTFNTFGQNGQYAAFLSNINSQANNSHVMSVVWIHRSLRNYWLWKWNFFSFFKTVFHMKVRETQSAHCLSCEFTPFSLKFQIHKSLEMDETTLWFLPYYYNQAHFLTWCVFTLQLNVHHIYFVFTKEYSLCFIFHTDNNKTFLCKLTGRRQFGILMSQSCEWSRD